MFPSNSIFNASFVLLKVTSSYCESRLPQGSVLCHLSPWLTLCLLSAQMTHVPLMTYIACNMEKFQMVKFDCEEAKSCDI